MIVSSQRQLASGKTEVKAPTSFEEFVKLSDPSFGGTPGVIAAAEASPASAADGGSGTAVSRYEEQVYNRIVADDHYESDYPMIKKVWNNALLNNFDPFFEYLKLNPHDLFQSDAEGRSLLHWAAFYDNVEAVRHIVKLGLPVDVQSAGSLQTPLIWAASRGSIRAMRELLSLGADKTRTDSLGVNALLQAVQNKQMLSVHFLINCGLSLDSADHNGCTCAHWAAYVGLCPVLNMLSPLQLNQKDSLGMTPLHRAVDGNQLDAVELLVSLPDVRINPLSNAGHTPLDRAKLRGYPEIESALVRAGGEESQAARSLLASSAPLLVRKLGLGRLYTSTSRLFRSLSTDFRKRLNDAVMLYFWIGVMIVSNLSLYLELTPLQDTLFSPMVVLFSKVSVLVLCAIQARLSLMDPGAVDRTNGKDRIQAVLAKFENEQYFAGSAGDKSAPSAKSDSLEPPEICYSCEIVKPDRSKHCSICKKCVHKLDHHCGWLNNCVGLNNNRLFVVFLAYHLFLEILACSMTVMVFYHVSAPDMTWANYARTLLYNYKFLLLASIANFPGVYFLALLLNQQVRNILEAMTTNERMNVQRYRKFWVHKARPDGFPISQFRNPYDSGSLLTNAYGFFFEDLEKVKQQYSSGRAPTYAASASYVP